MKPPVPYYGGKQTLAKWITSQLPDHVHYVEPFAGSLAVLLAKSPSQMETANDLDAELVTFWRVLRDRPEDLRRVCKSTPHSREEYELALQPATDHLEVARRVWVRLTQGRAGKLSSTGWRRLFLPAGGTTIPDYLESYEARMEAASARLRRVSLESRPALEVIADYGSEPGVLLYVDPPYLRETRSGVGYRFEMPHPKKHVALAEALVESRAAVVLSGYRSTLYDELYAGWHCAERATQTAQGGQGSPRVEVLWSNRPLGRQPSILDALEAS